MRETDFLLVASDILLHGHSLTINIRVQTRMIYQYQLSQPRMHWSRNRQRRQEGKKRSCYYGAPPSQWIGATFQNIFVAPPLNLIGATAQNIFVAPPLNSTGATFQNFFVAPPFNLGGATAQFCRPSPQRNEGVRSPNWG